MEMDYSSADDEPIAPPSPTVSPEEAKVCCARVCGCLSIFGRLQELSAGLNQLGYSVVMSAQSVGFVLKLKCFEHNGAISLI